MWNRQCFVMDVTATDFLALLYRSEESEMAFVFAHCEVSERRINNFTTEI